MATAAPASLTIRSPGPLRILITANYLDAAGGLERTQLTNCAGLARRGHRLDLVYVHSGSFEPDWRDMAETMSQVPGTLPRRAHPLRSTFDVTAAVRRARRLQPDVVYVYRYWDLPFAVAVARGRPTAVVYHLCLPPPDPLPRWLRAVLGRVDATVSVSRHTLDLWRDTGLDLSRATVALTAVDIDHFAPGDARTRAHTRSDLGLGEEDFVILFAGRISPEKGIDVLVEAFGQLSPLLPRGRLVVVGSPSPASSGLSSPYESRLHALGDGLPVTWLPRRADVVPLLQAADVAVVPSRWPEPLSRSIIEPLACGVPVVATDVGGSPEVLTGWLSEYLVPSDDPGALAARLQALHDWRTNDPELGERCRQAAESRLSLSDELDVVEATMRGAVGAARTKRRRRREAGHRAR
ncbi:MAG TPA: glycosyltransferase family 4 protein [Acidimicrobiales bacterium]|nr:glycosyltransferase family 4 protein [Acidimicrobiales bacterium]